MINRRFILAGAAALAFIVLRRLGAGLESKYPELTFAVVPAENASGVTERWTPFVAYLSKELGVKVNLRIANDYAAVIEGQRSGNIQIASYGSASFARARLTGVKTDAFANDINSDGSTGYYSMFFVKASSPYKNIDQLKGKNLGLVDPNSTSGNNVPRFELDKMGISDADTYFGKVVFTGSHENALLALSQGTVDVAANQWTSDDDSTLAQMLHKGMLKNADGTRDEEGRFPDHPQVGADHQRTLCLQFGASGRFEGRDRQGVHGIARPRTRPRSTVSRTARRRAFIPPRPRTGTAPSS